MEVRNDLAGDDHEDLANSKDFWVMKILRVMIKWVMMIFLRSKN